MKNEALLLAEEGSENVVAYKSFALAVRIVKLARHLRKTKQKHLLSKQLLRSGTSGGANVEEVIGGVSRPDFAAKLGSAYQGGAGNQLLVTTAGGHRLPGARGLHQH